MTDVEQSDEEPDTHCELAAEAAVASHHACSGCGGARKFGYHPGEVLGAYQPEDSGSWFGFVICEACDSRYRNEPEFRDLVCKNAVMIRLIQLAHELKPIIRELGLTKVTDELKWVSGGDS